MASIASGVFVAINGIDVSGVLKSFKMSSPAELKDATTLNQTINRTWRKGLTERNISGEGFFQSSAFAVADANGLFQTALANTTGNYLILFARDGGAVGAIAEMMNSTVIKYDVESVVGELIMATFEAKASKTATGDHYNVGVMLMLNTAISSGATFAGTTYDNGAGGTGYVAQIHVIGGDGAAQVTIQHSTNGSVWVDLVAAASYAALSATEVKSTVTAVSRYVRALAVALGTVNAVSVAVKIGYPV